MRKLVVGILLASTAASAQMPLPGDSDIGKSLYCYWMTGEMTNWSPVRNDYIQTKKTFSVNDIDATALDVARPGLKMQSPGVLAAVTTKRNIETQKKLTDWIYFLYWDQKNNWRREVAYEVDNNACLKNQPNKCVKFFRIRVPKVSPEKTYYLRFEAAKSTSKAGEYLRNTTFLKDVPKGETVTDLSKATLPEHSLQVWGNFMAVAKAAVEEHPKADEPQGFEDYCKLRTIESFNPY